MLSPTSLLTADPSRTTPVLVHRIEWLPLDLHQLDSCSHIHPAMHIVIRPWTKTPANEMDVGGRILPPRRMEPYCLAQILTPAPSPSRFLSLLIFGQTVEGVENSY
jgi:hypothetical protein